LECGRTAKEDLGRGRPGESLMRFQVGVVMESGQEPLAQYFAHNGELRLCADRGAFPINRELLWLLIDAVKRIASLGSSAGDLVNQGAEFFGILELAN